jgi:hypothetical protein
MKNGVVITTIWLLLGAAAVCSISNAQGMDPKIRLVLAPAPENLEDLRMVLRSFAEKEELSIAESRLPPKEGKPDFLMMKLSRGTSFTAIVTNFARDNKVFVGIYEPKENPDFERLASRLEQALREKWPYISPYKGP